MLKINPKVNNPEVEVAVAAVDVVIVKIATKSVTTTTLRVVRHTKSRTRRSPTRPKLFTARWRRARLSPSRWRSRNSSQQSQKPRRIRLRMRVQSILKTASGWWQLVRATELNEVGETGCLQVSAHPYMKHRSTDTQYKEKRYYHSERSGGRRGACLCPHAMSEGDRSLSLPLRHPHACSSCSSECWVWQWSELY